MATLKDFFTLPPDGISLQGYIQKYGLKNFVETGTGIGETVGFVLNDFEKVISIEIMPELIDRVAKKYDHYKHVEILEGDSSKEMKSVLVYFKVKEPTLFFLDAHFPGADFHYREYGDEKNKETRLPLESEINAITEAKDTSKDMFIIDDLRVYESGNFEAGECPLPKEICGEGIDFIYEKFSKTHNINKDYRFQGFLIITPKK